MRFLYEETAAGIRILRSFGGNPSVVLPEMVEGKPVTELGSYAFSDHIDQKDLEKAIETGRFCREDGETADGTDENLSVSGEKVSEVFLPETLKKIGRYAFYNCRKLKKIALGGTCMDVGAGVFSTPSSKNSGQNSSGNEGRSRGCDFPESGPECSPHPPRKIPGTRKRLSGPLFSSPPGLSPEAPSEFL